MCAIFTKSFFLTFWPEFNMDTYNLIDPLHDCGHAHPGKSQTSMTCFCFSILRDDLDNSSWHSLVNYHWSMTTETSYQHQLSFMYITLHAERIGNKEQQLHIHIIHCPIFVFRLNSCCVVVVVDLVVVVVVVVLSLSWIL